MLVSRPNSVDQLVKTPTPVYGTEGRYAAALYSAASKNKALEAVEKDLKTMTATLGKDAQFAAFLADPSGKVHHILAAKGANLRIYGFFCIGRPTCTSNWQETFVFFHLLADLIL